MKKFQHFWTSAAAFGLAASVQAGFFAGSTDFEGQSPLDDGLWSAKGDAEIQTDASVSTAASRPANYDFADNRDNVLVIDNDEPILRSLQSGGAAASVGSGIYADVLVKGTALANGADAPEPGTGDKLLAYFRVNGDGTETNLCVMAAANEAGGTAQEFRLAGSVDAAEWHRVVIAAKANGAYQFYLDGDAAANLCKTADEKATFYALTAGDTVSSIGFKGSGRVDDLVLSTFVPSLPVTTLTWDTSLASVSYTVDGVAGDALVPSAGSYVCQIPTGATVVMTGNNGYRSFSTTGTTLETPTGLAYYTDGDGTQANPYEIPTFEALVAMKDAVASDASYRSAHYVQTADIDGTGKEAFAGIGTYEKVPTAGVPFTGTYNGQGHVIANITRAGGNTQGIFNQVGTNGVVENLVVSNMCWDSSVSGEYGFAIVGNAGGGATLRNLTAAGVFGAADKPGTHNMAGIVVRLSPGATAGVATTIDSCTNNATIYGAYTKLGGINAIVQDQTGFKNGKVVFENCANNGTLVCKRTAAQCAELDDKGNPKVVTGQAGIVGYFSGTNVELTGCYSNGEITNADGANTDKDGALVGWTYGGTIKDNGGNSAPSNKKMIGTWGSATETGFQYATVENGVATTLVPPYTLAEGETYLLEGNATPSFALAAAGDTIAFDTALGYTLTGTGITAAEGLAVTSDKPEGSTVTTFTAAVAQYTITWTDHGGTVKTETLDYGATPTAPAAAPVQYVENGLIYTGTWPTPAAVTADATYAAFYDDGTPAVATVITIADAGATTNTVGTYATLAAAVAAAGDGDTIVLLADVNEAVVNDNDHSFTIDLNGKTWSADSDVLATTAGTITIEATNGGEMTTEAVECCAVWAKGGDVVINGGTFTSKDNKEATIYVSNANSVITINGGTFENTDTRPYAYGASLQALTLNVKNDLEGQHIIINGGTFIGNDPQLGDDTAGGTSAQSDVKFVSDGFVAIDDGNGNFVVQPGYNVTFDANGGAPAPEAQRVAAGGTATAPATAPVKAGYTFNGWTLGGAAFDFDTGLVDDITLVAAFDSAVATVMTIADAGATTNYAYFATLAAAVNAAQTGDTVVLLANVNEAIVNTANKNFTIDLNGRTWSADSDVLATTAGTITIEATNGGTMATEAAQCCAVWAKGGNVVINGGTFTSKDNEEATIYVSDANSVVTINGGTFENTDTRPYRWKTSLHALTLNVKNDLVGQHLVINGGTFIGNDPQLGDDTAGGTSAQSDVKFVSDGFVAIDDGNGNFVVQPGYNVTFDANGGTPAPEAQRVAAGGTATEPAEPTKEGYTFDGWFADGASVPFDFDTVLDDDIELVAAWSEAQHETPHVDVGGGLAAWNAEHPGNAVDPVKIDGEGFKASFIAPAEGYYYLMTASTPASSDEAYTADLGTEYYVGASDVGKPVTLVDDDMSATSKFYKIGYSAEAIDAGN